VAVLAIFLNECPRRRKAEMLFRLVDDDDSGEISAFELACFLKDWGPKVKRAELLASIKEIFAILDTDRQGTVELDEWLDGVLAGGPLWEMFETVNPFQKFYGRLDRTQLIKGCGAAFSRPTTPEERRGWKRDDDAETETDIESMQGSLPCTPRSMKPRVGQGSAEHSLLDEENGDDGDDGDKLGEGKNSPSTAGGAWYKSFKF